MWMRKLRGPNTYPVVQLADTFMNTRFGGRQRPHFKIVRWIRLGGEGGEVQAMSPPAQADQPQQAAPQAGLPLHEIKEPTLKEEMGDEIPFNDPVPELEKAKASVPPLPNPRRNLKKPARDNARKAKRRPASALDAG
jgi:hypothetical protein